MFYLAFELLILHIRVIFKVTVSAWDYSSIFREWQYWQSVL